MATFNPDFYKGNIVMSRVRLARNLTEYPFPGRLDESQKKAIGNTVRDVLTDNGSFKLGFIDMSALSSAETVSVFSAFLAHATHIVAAVKIHNTFFLTF